ncbi:MAG: hypothetical protein FWD78_03210 [Treponema sp.]|nr:hypothetical protein [Treponema sp.]
MFREDLADYNRLCRDFRELHLKYEEQKVRITCLLARTASQRRRLAAELGKAAALTRRLSGSQRRQLGMFHDPYHNTKSGSPGTFSKAGAQADAALSLKPEPCPLAAVENPDEYKNKKELKAAEIRIITMIDGIKKKLLRLQLLEMRLGELLISLDKSLQAYDHQWRRIKRGIYPLGIISVWFKCIRGALGGSHFTAKDIKGIAFLQELAGNILNMAEFAAF